MRESGKSNAYRPPEFFAKYLTGRVIDIGCSDDPVTGSAEKFDIADGNANEILKFRPAQSYDAVYSSHCLEHLNNPVAALRQWWDLLKPGGYSVVGAPDENLYEQGIGRAYSITITKRPSASPAAGAGPRSRSI